MIFPAPADQLVRELVQKQLLAYVLQPPVAGSVGVPAVLSLFWFYVELLHFSGATAHLN